MKILDAIQECSGLIILVERIQSCDRVHPGQAVYHPGGHPESLWIRPPERGLSLEEAERLIEEQGVKVQGRL